MNRPEINETALVDYIAVLMNRLAYLNQLRVNSIVVFSTVSAALIASVRFSGSQDGPISHSELGGLAAILLFVGSLVFLFDLRCRARASAVSQSVRARLDGDPTRPVRQAIGFRESLDEDAAFSSILMVVNALLATAVIRLLLPAAATGSLQVGLLLLTFCGQYVVHWKSWPRLAATKMDELPDDSLLTKRHASKREA